MEDLLNRTIDMYSVLHTVCASCDIVLCIHQVPVHGKKLLWISKGHAITLFQVFNMTGTIGHEYKILLWLQGQYFKGWRFKHLRDNKIKKIQIRHKDFPMNLFICFIMLSLPGYNVVLIFLTHKSLLSLYNLKLTWPPFTLCLLSWCFYVEICIYWRIFMLPRSHFILLISFTELLFFTPDW